MRKIFILEDNPDRIKFFKWYFSNRDFQLFTTKDVEEAKVIFEKNKPFSLFLLDHDLDGEFYMNTEDANTGHQFAKFLAGQNLGKAKIIIHSINPDGAKNMNALLEGSMLLPFNILANGLIKREITIG